MHQQPSILIVDDELHVALAFKEMIEPWGFNILTAFSGKEALNTLETHEVDLVMSDHVMPGMNGLELLSHIQKRDELVPFVMITGQGSIDIAAVAMRQGAVDYMMKPCRPEQLRAVIDRAMKRARLSKQHHAFKKDFSSIYGFDKIITRSSRMFEVMELASKVSTIPNAPVVIYGESGTGKELLARAIHRASGCLEERFLAVNCSGIPQGLMESELFGHVKGAFTGAEADREGKFGLARQGTILLDEIGDMPVDVQPKLLRVLEEGCYEKVGANRLIGVDTRVIAATHHHLEKLIVYGKFRRDLFHRINRFPIMIPPLRERREDIPLLVKYFLEDHGRQMGKPAPEVSTTVMRILKNHPWPGNVRELKHVLERAMIVTDGGGVIGPDQLGLKYLGAYENDDDCVYIEFKLPVRDFSLNAATQKIKDIILEQCDGNKSKAAEILKVNRKRFYPK